MKTSDLTSGEIATLIFLNNCDSEENRFVIPRMTNQIKGYCSALQRKKLVVMHNGETCFDGEITKLGYEILKLANEL